MPEFTGPFFSDRSPRSPLKKLADEAMQHDLGISRNRWDQDASRTRAVNTRFP